MEKKDYINSVTEQVKELKELAQVQADICFDLETLKKMMDPQTAGKIKRVIITGCGDSYSAAGSMSLGFKKLSGLRMVNTPDIMDFCHFYTKEKILKGCSPEEVLVLSISFSGGAKPVAEALTKANELGASSMLITRTPDSLCGRAAAVVFDVKTPAGLNTPGLRSYYASMVGISAIGAYIGLCNGTINEERFAEVKAGIIHTTENFMAHFDEIDDLMFSEAVRMKDLEQFEVMADANEDYSAQFVEQKFIECGGVFCDHVNSEEFVHISIMYAFPEKFGMVVMVNKDDPSISRMKPTLYACMAQGRPTVVVTDADPEYFATPLGYDVNINMYGRSFVIDGSTLTMDLPTFCRIPTPAEQWMSPFVDFIPGSLLAGYQAAVNERKYFNGRYNFRTHTWEA